MRTCGMLDDWAGSGLVLHLSPFHGVLPPTMSALRLENR